MSTESINPITLALNAGLVVSEKGSPDTKLSPPSESGWTFRGDPSVPRDALDANWVPEAKVVYIGKAKHGRLRERLSEFVSFGRGGKHRHWGGRLIWQLDLAEEVLFVGGDGFEPPTSAL